MSYVCNSCGATFDVEENERIHLINIAKRTNGVAKGVTSCPNQCNTFIVGVEWDGEGWLLFTKNTVDESDKGKSLPVISTERIK